ncbi:phosphate transport regulator related to PhoU [Desulfosporosinus orientis DSM 765]|uniref:Phosphate transport regulator related to PhoU n=1 Tax=Desulfosporosinus orientis (strain ATCC 19365 / DSM 765 / NCIMB 8382 / VKM B-1628 / Singapore I) TaxID=768706 RepID=G7WID2_DESOD|nr:DUF47 family protein [Desulfosporosinus orientis]AET68580.1 phosphate transport regulator related to PhoU [Desulfosporosinus orientis DSM 765]
MGKENFWEKLFPVKYDFYQMIGMQAEISAKVTASLDAWIRNHSEESYRQLLQEAETADQLRFDMESKLIEAFATPFDRQDIYSLSNDMDKIVEYAKSTLLEIEAFEVKVDSVIQNMLQQLTSGTDNLAEAISLLKEDPLQAQLQIRNIRQVQQSIEEEYRAGMALLFKNPDPMLALIYREVYHHIKDAEVSLGYTADTLHRIIMRLA